MLQIHFSVGQRLVIYSDGLNDNSTLAGTVRYVGTLHTDPSDRIWLGVEVDPPEYGESVECLTKPGSLGGVRYFNFTTRWPRDDQENSIALDSRCAGLHPQMGFSTAFLPLSSIKRSQLGTDFFTAVYLRYCKSVGSAEPIFVGGSDDGRRGKPVELVGVDEAEKYFRDVTSLESLDVESFYVNSCDRSRGFADERSTECSDHESSSSVLSEAVTFSSAKFLSLTRSLLSSFSDVFHVLSMTPNLETLILTGTRFSRGPSGQSVRPDPESGMTDVLPWTGLSGCAVYPRIRKVGLKATGVEWTDLKLLSTVFPNLNELEMSNNPQLFDGLGSGNLHQLVRELQQSEATSCGLFSFVRSVVVQCCGIRSYEDIFDLFLLFPRLEVLGLNGNCLSDAGMAELRSRVADWKSGNPMNTLRHLWIEDNHIKDCRSLAVWSEITGCLEGFRWQGNPVHQPSKNVGVSALGDQDNLLTTYQTFPPLLLRQVVIAIFPNLRFLNGGEVSAAERRQTEIYFLSLARRKTPIVDLVDPQGTHRRRLEDAHQIGLRETDDPSGSSEDLGRSSFGTVVEVRISALHDFEPGNAQVVNDAVEVTRQLPLWLTIKDLKALCQKVFSIPTAQQKLSLLPSKSHFSQIPLSDDDCPLGYYGVCKGSCIVVTVLK